MPTQRRGTFDFTINIPTVIAVISSITSGLMYFQNHISALELRQAEQAGDIRVLQSQVNSTGAQIQQFRIEVQQGMNDMKMAINGNKRVE